jgi:surfeit locus 1 family protein
MPWLTAIVAVMLAILISLGVWQYQRLQWKTDLLSEVEASVSATPLTSLQDLERAIDADEPVDFRRISIDGVVYGETPVFNVYKSQAGGIFWDRFVAVFQDNKMIYVRTQPLEDSKKKDAPDWVSRTTENAWVGYVREDHPMGRVEAWLKSKPSPERNRWFKFNQDGSWGDVFPSADRRISHYIEVVLGETNPSALPVRRPTIRNNHRDYMLTWFSFAGLLIIFYLLIHRRAGRLLW